AAPSALSAASVESERSRGDGAMGAMSTLWTVCLVTIQNFGGRVKRLRTDSLPTRRGACGKSALDGVDTSESLHRLASRPEWREGLAIRGTVGRVAYSTIEAA